MTRYDQHFYVDKSYVTDIVESAGRHNFCWIQRFSIVSIITSDQRWLFRRGFKPFSRLRASLAAFFFSIWMCIAMMFSWNTGMMWMYPLLNVQKAIEHQPFMVDLPMKNVIFYSDVNVYQRVMVEWFVIGNDCFRQITEIIIARISPEQDQHGPQEALIITCFINTFQTCMTPMEDD